MLCYSFNSFMSHVLLSSNINIYNGCAPQLIHDVDLTTVSLWSQSLLANGKLYYRLITVLQLILIKTFPKVKMNMKTQRLRQFFSLNAVPKCRILPISTFIESYQSPGI